ncbi:MAG TPA: ABC transporter permease [Candidatus Udaeobacter sp.]|jgi:putative ABC transport system permease protein|nr:ABC transporter permease [Candidatus Udaeobacter sp.]
MLKDLRFALRQLFKQPGFAFIAVLVLALGIGANTAIFSVVNAVLLRPLPYPHSEQLVLLRERLLGPSGFESGSVSYMNYLDWRAAQKSFTDLALARTEGVSLSASDGTSPPEAIRAGRITANYLSILQVPPLIGRDFVEGDDVPGAAKVALISERVWRKQFGALPIAIGQRLNIDGVPREIIGVVSERVRFPRNCDVFLPLADLRADHDFLSRGNHDAFSCLGRLKSGATLKQAIAELDTISADLSRRYPDSNTGRQVSAKLLLEYSVGEYRYLLGVLLAAVACVFLIACANVANLQLARGLARRKELAVRAALGASRWDLARQMLVESGVVALLGGICAVLIAVWSLDTIRALLPPNVPRFQETNIDGLVLGITTVISVVGGLLVGIWPAFRVSNTASVASELHEESARGTSGAQRQRARGVLVIAQVALAVLLLAAAGLTLKSFWRSQQVPLGFNPRGVLTMSIALPPSRYASPEKIVRFYDQLVEKVGRLPGVSAAAVCNNAPFDHHEWDSSFHITGTPPDPHGQEPTSEMAIVSPDYFRGLGMAILRGRNFGLEDVNGRPGTVVIDELAAQKFFPGTDPIGKQIDDPVTITDNISGGVPLTIIGIVPHTRNNAPGDKIDVRNLPMMYFSASQFAKGEQNLIVRAKAGLNPHSLVSPIKDQIATLDRNQAVTEIATMEENIDDSLASRRLTMTLLGVFAGLALILASIGLYGVMALIVTQRTRELGIRFALGASRGDVLRLVLGQGAVLVGIGLAAGLLGAFVVSRALTSVLYNVAPLDPAALISALLTLSLVALIACFVPARRASRVDPIEALRAE